MQIEKIDKIPPRKETRGRKRIPGYDFIYKMKRGQCVELIPEPWDKMKNLRMMLIERAFHLGITIKTEVHTLENRMYITRIK